MRPFIEERVVTKTEPKCKSYEILKSGHADKLFILKLTLFNSIALSLEKFLVAYKSDYPMVPYLYTDLFDLITSLMKRVVKDEPIVGASAKSIMKIYVTDERNLKDPNNVDLGYAIIGQIRKNIASFKKEELLKFRKETRAFLVKIIEKLLQRCPLKYDLVKGATWLDPKLFLSSKNFGRLDLALKVLVEKDKLSGAEADDTKEQYVTLANEHSARDVAKSFKRQDRPDKLWFGKLLKVMESTPLKKMVCILLVLSYGQAEVERGFSIHSWGASHLKRTSVGLYFLVEISFCLEYFEKYVILST